ncbi:unnamed protein product [Calypogeia fissa]
MNFCMFSPEDRLDDWSNYFVWSIRVRALLRYDEVWDELGFDEVEGAGENANSNGALVDGEDGQVPAEFQPVGADGAPLSQREIDRAKVKAVSILALTVKDKFLPIVKKFEKDPVQCWVYLKQRFTGDMYRRRVFLEEKLRKLNIQEESSVQDFLDKVDEIVGSLACIGADIDDLQLAGIILMGLPGSWEGFRSTWLLMCRTPDFSYSALVHGIQSMDYLLQAREL